RPRPDAEIVGGEGSCCPHSQRARGDCFLRNARRACMAVLHGWTRWRILVRSRLQGKGVKAIGEFPLWLYPLKARPMVRKINWDSQFGRRLKLRDLHVFFTVVQAGSMAKAAEQLGVAQPTVSETIADLENSYGVRLLDRSSRGVEPTMYGAALHRR